MRVLSLSVLALLLNAACSSSAQPEDALTAPPTGGGGPAISDDGLPDSLEFEMTAAELPARDQVVLKVRASPARVYPLRFSLPPSGGDPLDAVLDRDETNTDTDGIASVLLTAPSSPTDFEVLATVGTLSQKLPLSVKDAGFTTVQVDPRYPTNLRAVATWVGSAYAGKSCAELKGIPPEDGEIPGLPAGTEGPIIPDVPAGQRLAITVRSGHFVGGCTSVEMLPPSPADRPQIVVVTVLNRPIDLSASSLAFSLDLDAAAQTWSSHLGESGAHVLGGLLGTSTDDVDALLDAMRAASGDSTQAFESARKAEGWDTLLRSRWGQSASTKLRDVVSGWLAAGRQSFAAARHPFSGLLTPLGHPQDVNAASTALLTLQTVAGLDATSAGFVDPANAAWSAGADDTVLLNTDLYFVRSELAAALAEAAALASDSSATSAPEALSHSLDCVGIASALTAVGSEAELAYAACDADCLASSCEDALSALWQRGAEVDGREYSRLSVTATGKALVGDTANLVG
ncbi:MAG TPA: hypothetical protein VEQ58_10045, partial [Polyangiaceae bacterium]|nr:hypothetical protein [Polyangiaceae bacterium]